MVILEHLCDFVANSFLLQLRFLLRKCLTNMMSAPLYNNTDARSGGGWCVWRDHWCGVSGIISMVWVGSYDISGMVPISGMDGDPLVSAFAATPFNRLPTCCQRRNRLASLLLIWKWNIIWLSSLIPKLQWGECGWGKTVWLPTCQVGIHTCNNVVTIVVFSNMCACF